MLQPPWSSNYTTNINIQMNYWLAEVANLPECLPPLFDLIDALVVTGQPTAQQLYAAPGWVAHHNTDVWAYSQPVGLGNHDPRWSFWPFAGAWLVRHLWERVEHGADDAFARDRAWGPIRGAAEFYLAWLLEQPDGTLGTAPSTSPENLFTAGNGMAAASATSSALDLILIADLFDMLTSLAERLGFVGDPVVARAAAARGRIPAPVVSSRGIVQEWRDDFELPDPHHRHLSPLYFLHPGAGPVDAELAAAASATLDSRGDESTGWSLAWKMIMRARLGEADKISSLLALFFRDMEVDRGPWIGGLYPNLLSAHPPFCIDGNFGYVAAIAECFMQSHAGVIELLPAVPPELATGSVEGLVARTGVEVDLVWRAGATGVPWLVEARLSAHGSRGSGTHQVRYAGQVREVTVPPGATVVLDGATFSGTEDSGALRESVACS